MFPIELRWPSLGVLHSVYSIDLLIYIGGKLAGLNDWKPASFGGGMSVLTIPTEGPWSNRVETLRDTTISQFTFDRRRLGSFCTEWSPAWMCSARGEA